MPGRTFCSEKLSWHEGSWDVPKEQENQFCSMTVQLYSNVYDALCSGAELEVKPEHVRQQIAIIEEAHRQNGSY